MGMTLVTHWKCDRCDFLETHTLGEVPNGWMGTMEPIELVLDVEDGDRVDIPALRISKKILCPTCVSAYRKFLGIEQVEQTEQVEERVEPSPEPSATEAPQVRVARPVDVTRLGEGEEVSIDVAKLESDVK